MRKVELLPTRDFEAGYGPAHVSLDYIDTCVPTFQYLLLLLLLLLLKSVT